MIPSPITCVACGATPTSETRNGLSMRVCPSCNLFWRDEFDLDMVYYEEKDIALEPEKIRARKRNVKDRIAMIRLHAALENVCDIGCGEGLFLQELISQGATHVIGMEPGADAAEYARSLGLHVVSDPIENIEDVAEKNKPITLYTLFHVIEHLPDPVGAIKVLKKLLPPGGSIVLETPDFQSVSFLKRNYRHKHVYPEHLFYWNPRSLRMVLEREGFEVVSDTHRDFDRFNLDLTEGLRRLGILSYPKPKTEAPVVRGVDAPPPRRTSSLKTIARTILSKIGSVLVILSGRGEYIWMIARVPKV